MSDRVTALEEIIGEYRDERAVELTRLDEYRLKRAKLELAREILQEHGETAEADQLKLQIHELDHKIQASETLLGQIDRLIAVFQKSLEKMREAARKP